MSYHLHGQGHGKSVHLIADTLDYEQNIEEVNWMVLRCILKASTCCSNPLKSDTPSPTDSQFSMRVYDISVIPGDLQNTRSRFCKWTEMSHCPQLRIHAGDTKQVKFYQRNLKSVADDNGK